MVIFQNKICYPTIEKTFLNMKSINSRSTTTKKEPGMECMKYSLLQNRRWVTEIRAVSVFLFIMEFVSIFTGNASKYKWRHAQKQI